MKTESVQATRYLSQQQKLALQRIALEHGLPALGGQGRMMGTGSMKRLMEAIADGELVVSSKATHSKILARMRELNSERQRMRDALREIIDTPTAWENADAQYMRHLAQEALDAQTQEAEA